MEMLENRWLMAVDLHLADLGSGFEPNIAVNPLNPAEFLEQAGRQTCQCSLRPPQSSSGRANDT